MTEDRSNHDNALHFAQQNSLLKYSKTATVLNYFECYFIYTKVCKVYYICLFWLRDFENARAGRKVTLIVRFIFC